MDEKNKSSSPDNTPEIPQNSPPPDIKPVKSGLTKSTTDNKQKHRQRMRGVKLAYAFALLIAFGGALAAKIATEDALGNLNTPIESNFVTITHAPITESEHHSLEDIDLEDIEFELDVRNNLTDVPDTRQPETEAPTEEAATEATKSEFATPYKDYYSLPLGTDILKDYNPTTPTYNATMGDWRTHGAIDFKGPDGSQIKAISYGTVTDISDDPLYGTVITIDHGNDVIARYCGLNKEVLEVAEGDTVKSGQLLGYLGEIPCEKSDVSHLHFEIYYKGENTDPLSLMNK